MSHLARLYAVPFLWLQVEHRWQSSWDDVAGCCLLWLLLLRLAAAVPILFFPQNILLTSLALTRNSESVSATRISLVASSSSFIYLFPSIARDLQSYNHLPCLDNCV
jgi:hypothetical protein